MDINYQYHLYNNVTGVAVTNCDSFLQLLVKR